MCFNFELDTHSAAECRESCNDRGECINRRCHCFPGYTGPTCAESGYTIIAISRTSDLIFFNSGALPNFFYIHTLLSSAIAKVHRVNQLVQRPPFWLQLAELRYCK